MVRYDRSQKDFLREALVLLRKSRCSLLHHSAKSIDKKYLLTKLQRQMDTQNNLASYTPSWTPKLYTGGLRRNGRF